MINSHDILETINMIDHENLDEIKKLPVQGVSVLGGIWNYADPVNAFIKLSRAI